MIDPLIPQFTYYWFTQYRREYSVFIAEALRDARRFSRLDK